MFRWLFQKGRTSDRGAAETPVQQEVIDRGLFSDILDVPSRNFIGLCSRSPNNRYTLGWSDRDDSGLRGGARSSGLGRYLLLDGQSVVAEGRMERPNDGKVADNGVFILHDWQFTEELSGVFSAFHSDGRRILSRSFKANLYNNGLSADGRTAVCQTCNSPDQGDSSILAVFDLTAEKEIASWVPESGWASFYEFPPGTQTIKLGYRDGGTFSYSFSGEFIDRVSWTYSELQKGNLIVVERLLKVLEKSRSRELARQLLFSVDVALADARSDDNRTQAWAHKLRGKCLETQDDLVQALGSYEKALALDPKVGVKRRAEQLRKIMPTEG